VNRLSPAPGESPLLAEERARLAGAGLAKRHRHSGRIDANKRPAMALCTVILTFDLVRHPAPTASDRGN